MLISVSPNQTQSVTFPPQNSIVSPCWSLMATDIYIGLHNTQGLHLVPSWHWVTFPVLLGLRVRAIVIQCVSCFNDHFKHSTLVFYNMSQHLHYPAPGHGPYHQDSLLCIEMMGMEYRGLFKREWVKLLFIISSYYGLGMSQYGPTWTFAADISKELIQRSCH